MAEHNAIKYDGDLQKMLDRLGAVGIEEDGVTRLSETLYSIVNWRDYYEWYAVAGRNLCVASVSSVAAGGAGNRSVAILENNTTNVIAIVRAVYTTSIANTIFLSWLLSATPLSATTDSDSGTFLDWRKQNISPIGQIGQGRPRLTLRTKNTAAIPTGRQIAPIRGGGVSTTEIRTPVTVILPPGSSIFLSPDTDNIALVWAGFEWEERQLLASGEPAQLKTGN